MSTSFSRRQSFRFVLALALAFTLAAGTWPRPQRAANLQVSGKSEAPAKVPAKTSAEIEEQAKEAYGKLGVSFEENRGQADARVRYLARHGGATVFLTNEEAAFVLSAPEALARRGRVPGRRGRPKSHAVRMKFEGANTRAEVSGERELEGRVNYFRGSDPSKWRTDVKTYGAVRYRGIYEGIDLVYYGNAQGLMEYDFVVAPGSDPNRISLKVEGTKSVKVDAAGDLVIKTPVGTMRQHKPVVYQEVEGGRREVAGGYVVRPGGRVRFKLGEYAHDAPLVIDPGIEYSTHLGGMSYDEGYGIAADSDGNAYVTGTTHSYNFPTANAFQSSDDGELSSTDAFVTKLNAAGSALAYSTYLGGKSYDEAHGIAVDSAGNAYVTGHTFSTDFPTANPVQGTKGGDYDAFVTKLNAAGSALAYSTYLGGNNTDEGHAIAVDSAGNAYVTGYTRSLDFPTANALQVRHFSNVLPDAFVTKINPDGSALVYSTYLGGSREDRGTGIAVDSAGNAYVTGHTYSYNFPTKNPIQDAIRGNNDAFVTKLNAAGSALVYSTYLGGSLEGSASGLVVDWPVKVEDRGTGIAVDSSGNAYVTGYTSSTDFPTVNAIQSEHGGSYPDTYTDAFVAKLNPTGSALVYSTYLGGKDYDEGHGIAADSAGNAYVVGRTKSTDFPKADVLQETLSATYEGAFLTKLNPDGSAFIYSTMVGGSEAHAVTADSAGNAYVTGDASGSLPTTGTAFQPSLAGYNDAFVMKITNTPFIQGRVTAHGAAGVVGLPWVTVKLTGTQTMSRVTNERGYYAFNGLVPGGDYTVTASKGGLYFAPPSRSFNNLNAFLNKVNFATPTLAVNGTSVKEGDTGEATAFFNVWLRPTSARAVTVNYRTAGGTAAAGSDYTPVTGQLTFEPGQALKIVNVKVKGDALHEPPETFNLILSEPVDALLPRDRALGIIANDDDTPYFYVNPCTVTESDAGTVNAVFTVGLTAASGQTVTVKYSTGGGTATAGTDYVPLALTTLTFHPGETLKTVTVRVKGDTVKESDETFLLKLSGATKAMIYISQNQGTITDDD